MLGSLLGTPLYMAPEQAAGLVMDERADVYSVCLVLYEMLYLRHPYADEDSLIDDLLAACPHRAHRPLKTASTPAPAPRPRRADVVPEAAASRKTEATRYQSMRAMIDVLDRRADGDICIDCPVTLAKSATIKSTKLIDAHPVALHGRLHRSSPLSFVALVVLAIRGIA
jgi:serine/threonine protein kinase